MKRKKEKKWVIIAGIAIFLMCGCEKKHKCVFCKGTKVCDGISCSFCGATGHE